MAILKHLTSLRISPTYLFYSRITNNWCCYQGLLQESQFVFQTLGNVVICNVEMRKQGGNKQTFLLNS